MPQKVAICTRSRKAGAPTLYTDALADLICIKVSECMPVHRIAELPGMVDAATIYRWLAAHQTFREHYIRAREAAADRMVAETREIADEPIDKMGAVERARVRIQVRQWAAERMAPKKYGVKHLDHSSSDRSMSPAPSTIIIEGA